MKYKVIKEFGIAKKGDILENSAEDPCLFTFEVNENNTYRSMSISDELLEAYEEDGFVELVEDENAEENDANAEAIDKLCYIADTIDTLLNQYEKDHKEVLEKYNNQEVPTCVKVEADTVYFNLTKVLNKIKSMINE